MVEKVLNIVSAPYSGTCAVLASLTSPSVFTSKAMGPLCLLAGASSSRATLDAIGKCRQGKHWSVTQTCLFLCHLPTSRVFAAKLLQQLA